ncbi:IS5 family transposase [Methylobacterium sp. J-026]|uniref:IS5 family transposase n=1 Tax=Methylobacterium sp. J-026 TaxID=2836624 RepID=UPI001FBB7D97|nr:IS5 family transposase [Methylobacterium sp. J-026]MCJ2136798.1 IS5 family transposase [Methylobacterium sp. J-026]
MVNLFWLSDEPWAVIEPFMPREQPGPERNDDRQIISGILHVLTSGCRWRDGPAAYGPRTTVYNRLNRRSRRGFWKAMLTALAGPGWAGDATALDSSYVRAHRSAQGGKGGPRAQAIGPSRGGQTIKIHARTDVLGRPGVLLLTPGNASDVTTAPAVLAEAPGRIRRFSADTGYDADWLRTDLRTSGVTPVIPGKRSRKRRIPHDRPRYRERWRIEAMFARLTDFRRIATPYDKLARNDTSALALAAVVASWC